MYLNVVITNNSDEQTSWRCSSDTSGTGGAPVSPGVPGDVELGPMKTITSAIQSNGTAQSSSMDIGRMVLQGKYFHCFVWWWSLHVWTRSSFSSVCRITRCALALKYSCCPTNTGVNSTMWNSWVPNTCPAGAFCNCNHRVCLGLGALKDLFRILSVYRFLECKKMAFLDDFSVIFHGSYSWW